MPDSSMQFNTACIHAGVEPEPVTGAIMTPIFQTSTYVQPELGVHKGFEYSRTDNPTRSALQKALAALEGGQFGLAFSSGLAATDSLISTLKSGEHMLVCDDVYGGTFRLLKRVRANQGIQSDFVDFSDLRTVAHYIRPETRWLWVESPDQSAAENLGDSCRLRSGPFQGFASSGRQYVHDSLFPATAATGRGCGHAQCHQVSQWP